jgi:hypothetical protein
MPAAAVDDIFYQLDLRKKNPTRGQEDIWFAMDVQDRASGALGPSLVKFAQ